VNDSHGDFRNLLPDELAARAEVLLGKPRDLGMMAGVDADDYKAVFLVGWHARSGAPGTPSHTINSFAFTRVSVACNRSRHPRASASKRTVALADLFATLPILRRADPLTLELRAPTMRYAVRVLNSLSAMSFMLR
jgi:D-aminopeptidase